MSPKRKRSIGTILVVLALLGVSISCQLPFSLGATPTPTPVPATPSPPAAACNLPDLVGMDIQAANAVLTALDLTPLRTDQNNAAPAGQVISQQPAAGTRLNPCEGQVSIAVSKGPLATPTQAATQTKPAPSATATDSSTAAPEPTSTAALPTPTEAPSGPRLADSENYDVLLNELFLARDKFGLLSGPWKKVVASPDSQVQSIDGWLQVNGKFEFYGGGAFQQNVRILIGGGIFGVGLNEFTVFVNYQDDKNNLRMTCSDQTGLMCDWYQLQGGTETLLTKAPVAVCSGNCDLQIELDHGDIRVYANDIQRMTLHNTIYPTGQIGLRIDAPASASFELDRIVVYNIPNDATAKAMFREDFGGDIDLTPFEGQYIGVTMKQAAGVLSINATAKSSAFYYQRLSNSAELPDAFLLSMSTRILSGAQTSAIGLIFRHQDSDNYYVYLVDGAGKFTVFALVNNEWSTILDWQAAAGFRAGEANVLTVKAQGSDYTILLNSRQIAQFTDATFTGGRYGFATELDNAGDQLRAEIYKIETLR